MLTKIILLIGIFSMSAIMGKLETDTANFSSESLPKVIFAQAHHYELAKELKFHLEEATNNKFVITVGVDSASKSGIYLTVDPDFFRDTGNYFVIESSEDAIKLQGKGERELEFALYTFLEELGLRMFFPGDIYYPVKEEISFPKNHIKHYSPSFEYRAILYPAAYEESFRKWHKLDWHIEDFGIWGHSFDKLIPPREFFDSNPEFFAFYEGTRRYESLCMTNNKGFQISSKSLENLMTSNPRSRFYSVSQNDDLVYCECRRCDAMNKKYGSPSGSLYFFLNKHAKNHQNNNLISLAYLHTANPPQRILPKQNIISFYCPIEMNRGMSIQSDHRSEVIRNRIRNWKAFNPNLFLWDYTVQFTHYLSPFPNIHTFQENLKFYKSNGVLGLFLQGYADVPGDFAELRQYLLSKLLWDSDLDMDQLTNEFLAYFYGPAYPYVWDYFQLLHEAQQVYNRFLDIYSGPVQKANDFLSPYYMDQFDQLIASAEEAVVNSPKYQRRIEKIRLGLEYVYFEQSKFYGKDRFGMFKLVEDEWIVPQNLTSRVKDFAQKCEEFGIYELGEGGFTPEQYFENWVHMANNSIVDHKGIGLDGQWLTEPAPEYQPKGFSGLVDGTYGSTDFNIGWTGWYGNDAVLMVRPKEKNINKVELNFLNDQRHWIFPPKSVTIQGFQKGKWQDLKKVSLPELEEDFEINSHRIEINLEKMFNFIMLKIVVENQKSVPEWRKRSGKAPLLMIDEIVLK